MKPLKRPNLPNKKIKLAAIGRNCSYRLHNSLLNANIKLVNITQNERLEVSVESHSDLLIFHLGGPKILLSPKQDKAHIILRDLGFNVDYITHVPCSPYPYDVPLNAAIIGDYIIYNPKTVCGEIHRSVEKHKLQEVVTNQGYAKCSVCIVDHQSIITADRGIAERAKAHHLQVLLIQPGHIAIQDYEYGFIGGCSGKLAKDQIAFTGDISTHPDGNMIRSFIEERGIEIVTLSDGPLQDIGGIIPLAE